MADKHKDEHVEYQIDYFNSNHNVFLQPIPPDVVERTSVIVHTSGIQPGARVLDVGTGMGVLISHFKQEGIRAADIVGCDLSTRMLDEARRRHPDINFWEGDFIQLPTEFSNFDAIFFNACFGNLFDQEEAIAQACARLNDGGKIVISHPMGNRFVLQLKEQNPHLVLFPLPSEAELQQWCQTYTLELAAFREEPDLYLAILRKK